MRLAICLFGHLRTYQKTYKSFLRNIIEANQKDGWEVDVFLHTWDRLSSTPSGWQLNFKDNSEWFDTRALSDDDIKRIKEFYAPVRMCVETLPEDTKGLPLTIKRVNEICEEYEKEHSIQYDYILYTRCDILFAKPLHIYRYIEYYKNFRSLKLPPKHCFCANNFFEWNIVADPRHPDEWDLVYFANHHLYDTFVSIATADCFLIPIDYTLHRDFFIQRQKTFHKQRGFVNLCFRAFRAILSSKLAIQANRVGWRGVVFSKILSCAASLNKTRKKLKNKIKQKWKAI